MNDVIEYFQRDLSETEARQIVALTSKIWPDSKRSIVQRLEDILLAAESEDPEKRNGRRFVVWENGKAIAHARTFRRTIEVGDQAIEILALAGVCTALSARGRGLGMSVVRKAFEEVDSTRLRFSLFQTGVPGFYEKLNCKLIENQIVDQTNTAEPDKNPFWDKYVMVYPAHEIWPPGVVNLNGPGY